MAETLTETTVVDVMAELAALEDPRAREVNEKHGDDHGVDLTKLHVPMKKTLPFIQTADHNPHVLGLDRDAALERLVRGPGQQLELFGT